MHLSCNFVAVSKNILIEFTGESIVTVINGKTEKPKLFSNCTRTLKCREVPEGWGRRNLRRMEINQAELF